MASRLLGRHAHLLCRSSSQAPAAAAARLPLPVARPAEVRREKGRPLVTERLMSERTTIDNNNTHSAMSARSRIEELVDRAIEPEDVLVAWTKHGHNSNQAAAALTKWAILVQKTKGKFRTQPTELKKDSRILDMMKTISLQVSSVSNSHLVSVLQTLWIMDVCSTNSALGSVQTEVLWRIRRLTYKHLASLVEWGVNRNQVEDVNIVNSALKQLELRWTEISDAKTVSILIASGECVSRALMDKLEDKALELAESFSSEEIRKVCVSLALRSRRCVPLLRALSYHLLRKPSSEFTTPLMIDIAFAYGKLHFQHSLVFQRIASDLYPRVPMLNCVDVTRCAKSLGILRWLDIPLFESFSEHYIANSKSYTTLQLCNLLMTFASLNFQPTKGEEFYDKVHSVLEESLSGLEPFLQTDVVWSLCVLQQAKPHYIIPLTQENAFTKVSNVSPARLQNYKTKLLHIAATLHLEHPGSSDNQPSLNALSGLASSTPLSPLQRGLREALKTLVGDKTGALSTSVNTVYGWTIDAELVVDSDNKPIDMSVLKASNLSKGQDQALPAGARRLAFLAWEFNNFGSKSKDPLGRVVMMKRHLQLAGFITVEVPYYEFLELKTEWQKLAYLKDKIGKAVAEDMAR